MDDDDDFIRVAHHCTHVRFCFSYKGSYLNVNSGHKRSLYIYLQKAFEVGFLTFRSSIRLNSFADDFFLAIMLIYIIDVSVRCYGLGWRSFKANGWSIFDLVVSIGSFVSTLAVRFGNGGFASQQLQKLFLVSIAFKLVERTNSLNMLFKTAM